MIATTASDITVKPKALAYKKKGNNHLSKEARAFSVCF